jgi:poly(3-hydroxybutyrate) depolymerase
MTKAYVSTNPATAGVLLYLHGCDGLKTGGFVRHWFSYFERSGFKVVAPDSFGDPRPPISCPAQWPNKQVERPDVKKISEIRKMQTRHTLSHLKKQYPDKPIYIWGHSEGCGIASSTELEAAGIIMTGCQWFCSVGVRRVRADVPVLAFMDNNDPYIKPFMHTFRSVSEMCTWGVNNPKWQWFDLPGAGHSISINDKRVRPKVDVFLSVKSR